MTTRQYFFILLGVLLTVVLLASGWEFWLEDLCLSLLSKNHVPESLSERWEYVTTVSVFITVSLIVPALLGRQLIARQKSNTDKLIKLSETDHLTGLYDRGKITELLEEELTRHHRFEHGVSVILLDVDHFKEVNDSSGHAAGDRLLKAISARIATAIRNVDVAGRWGGEEFLVICPETSLVDATRVAERLRASIADSPFGEVGTKTVSCGVATAYADEQLSPLINRADVALYEAKAGGRNQVVPQSERNQHGH